MTTAAGSAASSLGPVSEHDRRRWDERYARSRPLPVDSVPPPNFLEPFTDLIPTQGRALDVACGQGLGSVWLAQHGLDVWGVDISGVAIAQARELAQGYGVHERCRFDVVDLDDGLPAGPPVDVLLCNNFRDPRLHQALIERLAPGGLLAIRTLSEVGAGPGPFRAAAGELLSAFGGLEPVRAGEADGHAWLLARALR